MVRKTSMGRQKIEIKKIENIDARQVCFSKRRAGLFKKASELCILCGAETSIVVFSPAGKVFSFGHPSGDSVIERFLIPTNGRTNSLSRPKALPDAVHRGATLRELSRRYTELLNQVDAEKKRKIKLEQVLKAATEHKFGWEADVEGLELHEFELFRATVEEMKKKVAERAEELPFFGMNSNSIVPQAMTFNRLLFKEERFDNFRSFRNQLCNVFLSSSSKKSFI
ncbi:agamous-like MADS-box protein AGL29 [Aristolochia californica]|uniref:agamous-like MADS-box protein AGL29 n=1 Tax=Aristolochia californica TaxID=171875 RepID=UPI0035D972B7